MTWARSIQARSCATPRSRWTSDVRNLVTFLRATGWRRDEARLLTWAAVDRDGGVIRLESGRSKSGKPRVFPFGLAPSLTALLEAQWKARDGLFVFHRDGQPLGVWAIRWAWKRATKRAGLPGRLVHDLRRSAARDFRRAGVSEGEIKALCGWKTRAMFDRYNTSSTRPTSRSPWQSGSATANKRQTTRVSRQTRIG
jgi:integrase